MSLSVNSTEDSKEQTSPKLISAPPVGIEATKNSESTPPLDPDPPKYTPCKYCYELIQVGARKCKHCDSYQRIRDHIGYFSTTVGMLLTFTTIIAILLPAFLDSCIVSNSNVVVTFQHFDRNTVVVSYTNLGRRSGTVGPSWMVLELPWRSKLDSLRLIPTGDELYPTIAPYGAKILTFSIDPNIPCSTLVDILVTDSTLRRKYRDTFGKLARNAIIHRDTLYTTVEQAIHHALDSAKVHFYMAAIQLDGTLEMTHQRLRGPRFAKDFTGAIRGRLPGDYAFAKDLKDSARQSKRIK